MAYQASKEICDSSLWEDPSHRNKKYYQSTLNQKILCEDCMKRIYDELARIIDSCIRQYRSGNVNDYALSTWREVEQMYCETVDSPYCIFGIETIQMTIVQKIDRSGMVMVYHPEVKLYLNGVDGITGSSMLFSLTSAYNYDALRMMVEQVLKSHLLPLSDEEVARMEKEESRCSSIE